MKINRSGMDGKLTGTLTVGQNFEGNKSVTLIEDSMGNLGKLEVGLEGSNETKIIEESASGISMDFTEEEQQALDAGNIETITTNVSEFEETTMSEEEKNQIVEEIK